MFGKISKAHSAQGKVYNIVPPNMIFMIVGPTLLLTSDIIRERLGASALDR